VKKSVGVQMLTIFACVYSNSIATAAISMGEGFLAFLFFFCKYHPPINIFDAHSMKITYSINGKNMMYFTMATSAPALPPHPYFDGFFWLP
jgi:hypothetical protein